MGLLAAFRRPGILLLLPLMLALAARMLVAPGWMIESDAGGSITVRTGHRLTAAPEYRATFPDIHPVTPAKAGVSPSRPDAASRSRPSPG